MSKQELTTEALWLQFHKQLRGFLRSRVSSAEVADDLLQETFLRIHQKLGQLDKPERIQAWVFQIARNLLTDHYRKSGRETALDEDEQPVVDANSEADLNQLISKWLPSQVEQLPAKYREAVRLFEVEGVAQQEIADRLGMSLSAVKSRIQRGREKLKVGVLECCSFEQDQYGNITKVEEKNGSCDGCC